MDFDKNNQGGTAYFTSQFMETYTGTFLKQKTKEETCMFQNKHCRSKGENTMKVTLKDGSVKEYSEPMSVNDIAFDIAGGL